MIKKFFTALTVTAFALFATMQTALASSVYEGQSFYGEWDTSYERQGDIDLGDGSGWYLDLRSTPLYCVQRGSSYSTMNRYIRSNYPENVSWFVDEVCSDGYVRICVYASWGDVACSTYREFGWY
jgi:hypothetical protein